jgi:CubicO group peptidase (beta-lactamase class C family)
MRKFIITFALLSAAAPLFGQQSYYPARDHWEQRPPAQLGFDARRLSDAVAYAKTLEHPQSTDSAGIAAVFIDEAPYNTVIGPWVEKRGRNSGLVIRGGYIAAEWGDTRKVDMTFSATKSYLSTVAGLAFDAGMIRSVLDTVAHDVPIPEFTTNQHNARITWHQLLNQTSEWQGELWGKPDWADRFKAQQGKRPVKAPGSTWTYNDVRVNVLALALLHVWRRPLPDVLREKIMDPIGASSTWRWHGYHNSFTDVGGSRMQSVSGGGHWGGGMQISARDHARFGLLFLRGGNWNGKQLISEHWIALATAPTDVNPEYGYLWWLNTNRQRIKSAPATAFAAAGAGGNYVYVDREHDVVIVLRWTRDYASVIERILAALRI